ncbi:MAG: hypothetical protein MZU95_06525 [Desulfomicrobium escambiense]|nr:hypothetical protein [Desulfomicrobium escambiense]
MRAATTRSRTASPKASTTKNENGKRDTGELHGVTVGGTEGYDKWNPGMDTMGRGIFVVDLADGSILFKASLRG